MSLLKSIYEGIEPEHHTKIRRSNKDWISKNQQERPQPFSKFLGQCKNWEINQVIVLEMWEVNER